MALQRNTKAIIERAVTNREKFDRGNVHGERKSQRYYTGSQLAELPQEYVKILVEHNRNSGLFILYSYQTPMAWYVEESGKWYYVDQHYSVSTTQHQAAYRYSLKGHHVVTLSLDENGNVVETEKEFY